jgi:hypothetical protein
MWKNKNKPWRVYDTDEKFTQPQKESRPKLKDCNPTIINNKYLATEDLTYIDIERCVDCTNFELCKEMMARLKEWDIETVNKLMETLK